MKNVVEARARLRFYARKFFEQLDKVDLELFKELCDTRISRNLSSPIHSQGASICANRLAHKSTQLHSKSFSWMKITRWLQLKIYFYKNAFYEGISKGLKLNFLSK